MGMFCMPCNELLQTRVQVLNNDLRGTFCRWFPGMKSEEQTALKAVA